MTSRMLVKFLFLLNLYHIVKSEADATSTSHVKISLGESHVAYNNEHLAGSSFPPRTLHERSYKTPSHFSPSPQFYHSTPSPPISYHPTATPIYGFPIRPYYHATTSRPRFFALSTPSYNRVHKVQIPKILEIEKDIPKPKEVKMNSEEFMKEEEKEQEKEEEQKDEDEEENEEEEEKSDDEEQNMDEEMEKNMKNEVSVMEKEMEKIKLNEFEEGIALHELMGDKIYHPSMTLRVREKDEEPLYIPKRGYPSRPRAPFVFSVHPHTNHHYRPLHKKIHHPHHELIHHPHQDVNPHYKSLQQKEHNYNEKPMCASDKYYCTHDEFYPEYEITNAAHKHINKLFELYADIPELNTELSVDLPKKSKNDESYLCPADITYGQIFRAKNTKGKWRIVVNNIKVNYQVLTQTARLEECLLDGEGCPLIPRCYKSKCIQKYVFHRFLVYDPYDPYFPFAIESFKLPASCACHIGTLEIDAKH